MKFLGLILTGALALLSVNGNAAQLKMDDRLYAIDSIDLLKSENFGYQFVIHYNGRTVIKTIGGTYEDAKSLRNDILGSNKVVVEIRGMSSNGDITGL